MSGRTKPFNQDCNQLHVPRLPPIPFPDRRQFPWLSAIEEKTDVIRAELLAALEADRENFDPYIQYAPGDPVNQWAELNHSLRWSVLKLWAGGQPDPANIERCPETAKAIAALPLVDIEGPSGFAGAAGSLHAHEARIAILDFAHETIAIPHLDDVGLVRAREAREPPPRMGLDDSGARKGAQPGGRSCKR